MKSCRFRYVGEQFDRITVDFIGVLCGYYADIMRILCGYYADIMRRSITYPEGSLNARFNMCSANL